MWGSYFIYFNKSDYIQILNHFIYNLRGFLPRNKIKLFCFLTFWYLNAHQQIQCAKIVAEGRVIEFDMDRIRIFIKSKTSKVLLRNCLNHQILQTAVHVAAIPQFSFSSAQTWDHHLSQTKLAAKSFENSLAKKFHSLMPRVLIPLVQDGTQQSIFLICTQGNLKPRQVWQSLLQLFSGSIRT